MACHDCMTTWEKNEEVRKEMRQTLREEYAHYAITDPARATALVKQAKKLGELIKNYRYYRGPDELEPEEAIAPADIPFTDHGYKSLKDLIALRAPIPAP